MVFPEPMFPAITMCTCYEYVFYRVLTMTSVGWCDGLLMAKGQVVVVVFLVSGDVFHLLDERREVDMLLVGDAFRLQDDQSLPRFIVGVKHNIL